MSDKGGPEKPGAICGKCDKMGWKRMVKCAKCRLWYHYECVRVTSGVLDAPWVCNDCLRRSIEESNEVLELHLREERRKVYRSLQQKLEKQWREQNPGTDHTQSENVEYVKFGNTVIQIERRGGIPLATSSPSAGAEPAMKPGQSGTLQRLRELEEANRKLRRQIELAQQSETSGGFTSHTEPAESLYEYPLPSSRLERILDPTKINPTGFLSPVVERTESSHHGSNTLSSKTSERTQKQRDLKLKALAERQALEKKQLEERQALEQELLDQQDLDEDLRSVRTRSSDHHSSGSNFLNVSKWLDELQISLNPVPAASETPSGSMPTPRGNRSLPALSSISDRRGSPTPPPKPQDLSSGSRLTSSQIAARHIVKDLPRFGGNPEDWPRFIAAYERTKKMCGFENDELLDRLERCLYDKAQLAVQNLLLHPNKVPLIIERLRTLYGNPEIIVETMVQRVRMMPRPKADRMDTIIDFGIAVQNLCATMEACQMDECLYNVALLQELVEYLPPSIKVNWALHRQGKLKVSLGDFGDWLGNLVEALSKVTRPQPTVKGHGVHRDRNNEHVHVHSNTLDDQTDHETCLACGSDCQSLDKCAKFLKMSPKHRWEQIREKSICRKCLKRHFKPCDTKVPCGKNSCKFLHHELLHDSSKHKLPEDLKATNVQSQEECNAHHCCLGSVLFKYAKVTIHGKGKSITTYAFLDSGSTCSLMEHSLWKELGLEGEQYPLCIGWTAGQGRYEAGSVKCAVDISSIHSGHRNRLKKLHTVESLQLPAQTMNIDDLSQHYRHLSNLPIDSYENVRPRILLGMDNAFLDHPIEAREGGENQPVAALTRLGWVVYGPCSVEENSKKNHHQEFNYHICQCDTMFAEMKQYFMLDSLGIQTPSKPLMSKDDERAMELLRSQTVREGNRYRTGLLWKFDEVKLPDSRAMALNRLRCLEKRMIREPELATALQAKIEDYEQKGYIRKLTDEEERAHRDRVWYLPIFVVTNPNKPGKLRIVWDAAATVRGASLNSFLLKGPDQLAPMVNVLYRFREYRTAVTGDIREMFHQVGVHPEDQHCQRFLWNNGRPGSTPSIYVMQVMTFGATCSPSCAQFVKNTNAERFNEDHPAAVNAIINDHYVDDMLSSVETEQEAIELATSVRDIHAQGGFEIRGWRSNSSSVLEALSAEQLNEKNLNVIAQFSTEKVLGMWWDSCTDTFTFKLPTKPDKELLNGSRVPTKKEVVSVLMSIFDPLGLLANVLMFLKVLIQEIWRSKVGWEDPITATQFEKWLTWLKVIEQVENVTVPRCYRQITSSSSKTNVQLHMFVDAGVQGCATVGYLRFEEADRIECAFVAGKTKVAPNKLTSIPRLEIDAGTMGVRLAQKIMEALRIVIHQRFFWTDARDVLCWLHSDHRQYTQFVGFRVAEILEKSDLSEWNYCPSKLNPADDGTKWTKTPDLSKKSRWMHALCFIQEKTSNWPEKLTHIGTTQLELKHSVGLHCATAQVIRWENFSTWKRLLRHTALCKRFVRNSKASTDKQLRTTGEITQEELQAAEAYLHRQAQEAEYLEEIAILTKAANCDEPDRYHIPKSSSLFKLSPHLDERGVLRMSGRAGACEFIEPEVSCPVILPRNHHITVLTVRSMHFRYHHTSNETVVNELRQRYRIPHLRRVCSQVRWSCQDCKNRSARPAAPLMADLPQARLAGFSRPFSYTGVDYFGPMCVAVGRRVEKRWGVLLTCLVTRAVHIEIAHSLNTDSCIMAIRNFAALRGTPLELFSDQGTNFIGSDRELREALQKIDNDKLFKEFTTPNTKWTFNPPSSPHMGGSWERMVQSVKKILTQLKLPRNPTDEVLRNTLLEIANVINSRPLTYIPIDDENSPALTPNHFLLGSSSGSKPLVPFSDDIATLRNNWKASQLYANIFWKRWVKEYLPTICRRTKWHQPVRPIQVGDVVVVVDPDLPRNCWPMGRVVSTNTNNKDGQVRSAVVRSNGRYYERPVVKLAVLDVGINTSKLDNDSSVLGGTVTSSGDVASVTNRRTLRPRFQKNTTQL